MKRTSWLIGFSACWLLLSSCSLDSFLYNERKLDRYNLSTAVIPEANRSMVTFDSEGNTLYGFYVVPPETMDTHYTVLYCHGNKHDIGEYWPRVEFFYRMGIRCFVFDYRGFGRSEGKASGSGLYADGRAALKFLVDSLHADTTKLFYYGYSLGNVVSIDLAASTTHAYPVRLIAEAPFASAEALLHTAVPLDLPGSFVIDDPLDNAASVRGIRAPFLLLHGAADDFVPYPSNGRVVFENAPEPKRLILVPGAIHENVPQTMGYEVYADSLWSFIRQGRPPQG